MNIIEQRQKICGQLLFNSELEGNGLLFADSHSYYCITAAHCVFGDNFDRPFDASCFKFQFDNQKLQVDGIFYQSENLSEDDICVLKLEYDDSMVVEPTLNKVSLSTKVLRRRTKLFYRGVALGVSDKIHNRNIEFDEPEQGAKNRFKCDISKLSVQSLEGYAGSDFLGGISGSPVFLDDPEETTCVGVVIEVPDGGESEKIIYAGMSSLLTLFEHRFEQLSGLKSKTDLKEEDRELFIGSIKSKSTYVSRSIQQDFDSMEETYVYHVEEKERLNLTDSLKIEKRILLTGNAGLGKTSELKQLAISLWDSSNTKYIPVYRNLRDFTSNSTLERYLALRAMNEYANIIFILDGVDEIADKQHFISELNNLTSELHESFRIVISCRTSIAKGIRKDINDFQSYSLLGLEYLQSINLLRMMIGEGVEFSKDELIEFYSLRNFLSVPSQLELVANEYKSSGVIQRNLVKLWEKQISTVLRYDHKKKFVKFGFDRIQFRRDASLVSIVNELCQKTIIYDDDLCDLVNDGKKYENFIIGGLVDSDTNQDFWFFEHRNIQEFFFAEALSKLDYESIIQLISIPKTSHLTPSLHNVASFLLNFEIETDRYSKLCLWLIENSIETFIISDSLYIPDQVRVDIFQGFFNKHCVESTLWIQTGTALNDSIMATFGNCRENFDFLIDHAKNEDAHHRVRKSALSLLSVMSVFDSRVLLQAYRKILNTQIDDINNIRVSVIESIESLGLYKDDQNLISELIELYRGDSSADVNSCILRMIKETVTPDKYFDFVYQEYKYWLKIEKREKQDNTLRFSGFTFNEIELKFEEPKHFILFISLYYKRKYDKDELQFQKILERVKYFSNYNPNFIENYIDEIIDIHAEEKFPHNEKAHQEIFKACGKQFEAFVYILEKVEFAYSKWILAIIADAICIDYVISLARKSKLDSSHYEGFRNILNSYGKYELAKKWESELIILGVNFKDELRSDEDFQANQRKGIERELNEFGLLINREKIKRSISDLLREKGLPSCNKTQVREWEKEFYQNREFHFQNPPIEYLVLQRLTRNISPLSVVEIDSLLDDDWMILTLLKTKHDSFKGHYSKESFPKEMEKEIEDFIVQFATNLELDSIEIDVSDSNSFSFSNSRSQKYIHQVDTILDLYENTELSITLPEDFLLAVLEFYRIMSFTESNEGFRKIANEITDKDKLRTRICLNIKKRLPMTIREKHFLYALEKKYAESYSDIREYLLNVKDLYEGNSLLNLYLEITNDISLLIERSETIDSLSAWTCLKILVKQYSRTNEMFVLNKVMPLIEKREFAYWEDALGLLFLLNHEDALFYYVNNFTPELVRAIPTNAILEYDSIKDNGYSLMERLFHLSYDVPDNDFYSDYHDHRKVVNALVNNLSKNEFSYGRIQTVLKKIKQDLIAAPNDTKTFFVNMLLKESETTYVASMSIPLTFQMALRRAKSAFEPK